MICVVNCLRTWPVPVTVGPISTHHRLYICTEQQCQVNRGAGKGWPIIHVVIGINVIKTKGRDQPRQGHVVRLEGVYVHVKIIPALVPDGDVVPGIIPVKGGGTRQFEVPPIQFCLASETPEAVSAVMKTGACYRVFEVWGVAPVEEGAECKGVVLPVFGRFQRLVSCASQHSHTAYLVVESGVEILIIV